jgi:hypothetical protein
MKMTMKMLEIKRQARAVKQWSKAIKTVAMCLPFHGLFNLLLGS